MISESPRLIVRGGYLVAGDAVVENGALYEEHGVIREVGVFDELRRRHTGVPVVGSADVAVLPGFVNTHQHGKGMSNFALGYLDDVLEPWVTRLFIGTRVDVYLDTLYAALALIEGGVTTAIHLHVYRSVRGYSDELAAALRGYQDAGLRVVFAPSIFDQNHLVYGDNEAFFRETSGALGEQLRAAASGAQTLPAREYLDIVEDLHRRYHDPSGLVTIAFSPSAPQWCSDPVLSAIRERAERLGTAVHTHLLETPYQRQYALRRYGRTLVEHLGDIGFLFPNLSCGHAVWLTERDIELLGDRHVGVAHNPSSNLRLRSGIAPVARMIQAGITVGLGTDNGTLNDDEDFLQEMRLAAKLHRLPGIGEWAPSSLDVWRMATSNGADLLLLGDRVGTLAVGRQADVVLLDISRVLPPHVDAGHSLLDRILYRARRGDVRTVMIQGRIVFDAGRFPHVDRDAIERRLEESTQPLTDAQKHQLDQLRVAVRHYYAGWLDGANDRASHYHMNERA